MIILPKFKFRAKLDEVHHGGFVSGYVSYRFGRCYLYDPIKNESFQVEEENVRQLAGYIKDGSGYVEVYEGDKLISEDNEIVFACVDHNIKAVPQSYNEFGDWADRYGWRLAR